MLSLMAMPPLANVARATMEECQNIFDAGFPDREDGSKPVSYTELIPVGDKLYQLTCRRNPKTGTLTATIKLSPLSRKD